VANISIVQRKLASSFAATESKKSSGASAALKLADYSANH
jgi:hypothetical protein